MPEDDPFYYKKSRIAKKPQNQQLFIRLEEAICWNDYYEQQIWAQLAGPYKRGRILRDLRHWAMREDEGYYDTNEEIVEVEL